MTIYRLWVVALSGQRLIYSRHFPHLEKRDNFIFPSISASEFLKSIFASLGIDFSNSTTVYNSTSTISNIDYDYSKMSRSSSSSGSLNSLVSTTTSVSKARGPDASDATMSSSFSALHNYLPLIVCRFMNNPRDSLFGMAIEEHQKLAYIDLIMLVFEKNGYLFICCPRLSTHVNLSSINMDNYYEQLLLEEQNISLSYSALQLISASFFAHNKSIKHLEVFISNCMPFGTLLKDGTDLRQSILPTAKIGSDSALVRLIINEFVSTSFQTFSRSTSRESEALFGTFTVDCGSMNIKELVKAEVKMTVDNLNSFSIAKPANCDQLNASTLGFDLKHIKLEPFNILHYRLNSSDEESPSSHGRKLFAYRYSISARNTGSNTKSLISSRNCQHLSIVISFNARTPLDEIKFAYFVVKFSFKQSKPRNEVQTADSSVANLIIRESIKASFGQVRSEGSNFMWVIGQKMPKSGKLSLEFDLLADESKLANLEAVCNFRFEHKMAFKLAYTKKIASLMDNPQAKITTTNTTTTTLSEDLEEVRECLPKQIAKLIEPQLTIGKLMLHTEHDRNYLLARISDRRPAEQKTSNLVTLEYRLTSFEYRLLPETSHRSTLM